VLAAQRTLLRELEFDSDAVAWHAPEPSELPIGRVGDRDRHWRVVSRSSIGNARR